MKRRGFTLLELMVATTIMGIAVVGLVSAISGSMHNAARLTDYDRAALLARCKMDELLLDPHVPKLSAFAAEFDRTETSGVQMGWQARVSPYDLPPGAVPGIMALERIELEVWWMSGDKRRSFHLDGYRRAMLTADEAGAGGESP